MAVISTTEVAGVIERKTAALSGMRTDFDSLIEQVGTADFVLLGEASHGTHEFYEARAEITKRLVREKGFTVIAWEADWPDALRVNHYVRGGEGDSTAMEALDNFKRFPVWMWRNADILNLVGWLRAHNDNLPPGSPQVGVYGLDLYSLYSSMEAVITYLGRVDPEAARQARQRYGCFEDLGEDPQTYGLIASSDPSLSCEEEVVQQLVELQRKAADFLSRDGRMAADELFFAQQNARVAKGAETYYRAMYYGRPNTWNLRDTHMVDTLDVLMNHLREQGENPKAIVWAHNSHLGDARATQMGSRGELNVGQLVRQRHPGEAFLVGLTTYTGTVTAASGWGEPAERKWVRPGMEGSYEALFHEVQTKNFLLHLAKGSEVSRELRRPLLERAIGVIYKPETERWSHYFEAHLADQFDLIIHFDESQAIEPLERTATWNRGEVPETYPSGL
jgi:erythromycin esterase-like protein